VADTGPPEQALLDRSHAAVIALMIVAEEVQQAVKGEDPKLNSGAVAGLTRLARGHPAGDDDVAEKTLG